jgi:hypothetical protein
MRLFTEIGRDLLPNEVNFADLLDIPVYRFHWPAVCKMRVYDIFGKKKYKIKKIGSRSMKSPSKALNLGGICRSKCVGCNAWNFVTLY